MFTNYLVLCSHYIIVFSVLRMYYAYARPLALQKRESVDSNAALFFLNSAGNSISNIGTCVYRNVVIILILTYYYYVGHLVTHFLGRFGGIHVTPTFIRKLLETDIAVHGTEDQRM